MNKITLKEFFDSKERLWIRCETHKESKKLLKAFHKLGKKWWNGFTYLEFNAWMFHEEFTCYSNAGFFDDWCKLRKGSNTIYKFEDIIFEEKPVEKIVITHTDNIVTATLGDKVAVSRCHPEDKFDLYTGAKIALDRLFGKEQPEFKPYLERNGEFLGYIGEETDIQDINGETLHIGDLVELEMHYHNSKLTEKEFICEYDWCGYAVNGCGDWKFTKGVYNEFGITAKIKKVMSYKDIPDGKPMHNVTAVLVKDRIKVGDKVKIKGKKNKSGIVLEVREYFFNTCSQNYVKEYKVKIKDGPIEFISEGLLELL